MKKYCYVFEKKEMMLSAGNRELGVMTSSGQILYESINPSVIISECV